MIKRFFALAFGALCLCATTGCGEDMFGGDDDKVASVPSYDRMEVSNDVYTGQKAGAKVFLDNAGAYVLHADNSYTLSRGGKVWDKGSWRVVDPRDTNPEFAFTAPDEPGLYSLSFNSKFSFYVDLPNGGIYGQSNSVSATVDVKLADAVDACWGDNRDRLTSVLNVKDTVVNSAPCKVWRGKQAFYDVEKTDLDSLGGNTERVYLFDSEGGLCQVVETTAFDLEYNSLYKEFEDGSSGYVNDSISNKYIYPHLIGVGDMAYYEYDGEATLVGEAADVYPVEKWGKYNSDIEKATLINAFWSGLLTSYEQKWILYDTNGLAVTNCNVKAYVDNDKFVVIRDFNGF